METHGIKVKDKLGYALGDMGGIMTFGLVSSFLNMFYTDVLGISAGKIAILMFVARIWDAINDPIWGAFIDSRKPTKYGRFRPYILWASFPLAIGAFLMFYKIPGLSDNQYLIYAYITYIFYGMMYTGINIPYGSLASVITDDEVERSSLSMWRSVGAGIGGLPAQILLPLVVYSTVMGADGSTAKVLNGTKLSIAVGALAVLHELALLERDLQLLLVAIELQQRRPKQAIGHKPQHRHERHHGPDVPDGAAQIGVTHDPYDGKHVQNDQQDQNDGEGRLHLRRPQLGKKLAHINLF